MSRLLALIVVACAGLDDTPALQAGVSAGDVRVSGSCVVDGARGVRIPSARRLDLLEASFSVRPGCERCRVLETIPGAEDVEVVGGTFIGDMTPCGSCWRIAVRVDGARRVTVRQATFRDWYTDAVWVGGPGAGSADVVLSELQIRGSRRNGVSLTHARGVTVERSYIGEPAAAPLVGAGIDVEPNAGEQVTDLVIRANRFHGNVVGVYDHPGKGLPGQRHEISNNVITASGTHGVIVNSVAQAALLNNVVAGAPVGISVGSNTEAARAAEVLAWGNKVTAARPLILAGVRDSRFLGNDLGGGRVETVALGATGRVDVEPYEPAAVCE